MPAAARSTPERCSRELSCDARADAPPPPPPPPCALQKALYLPNFTGITLSSGKVKKHTSKLCNGRISLVALAGTQFAFVRGLSSHDLQAPPRLTSPPPTVPSQDQVGKFINPIDNRLHQRADFQVVHVRASPCTSALESGGGADSSPTRSPWYQVSFQSTKLKAFLSSFFANNLRSLIPENRWSTYIISTQDLKSTLEDQCLGISNNLAGYVYLVVRPSPTHLRCATRH